MITVKNFSGTCKAVSINNGIEKIECVEGKRKNVGLDTYTVDRGENSLCCIFQVKKKVIDGKVQEVLIKKCEEGQFI
ncbi:MAG TPA: hypothetical protein DEF07_09060 [Nitrosomonas sp.]|nr:hypothetical protein [Nitrosomonas sp.]